jgi:hypothetical protein
MGELFEGATFAGLLLAGAGLAGVILVGPTAFVPPAIWNGPQVVALKLIAEHPRIWRVATAGFVIATVMTTAGLFVLPDVVGAGGAPLATAAAITFALAASLWLVTLAIRLAVTPAVASTFVAGGTIDPAYGPLTQLGHAMFVAFIFIGSASLVALGVAPFSAERLPRSSAGWSRSRACSSSGATCGSATRCRRSSTCPPRPSASRS